MLSSSPPLPPVNSTQHESVMKLDAIVKCHPYHFNSMRGKPTYPIARIENNLTAVKPFPNNWIRTFDEWKYFKQEKQFRMRCLFDADEQNTQIHLRSIDSLTNRHLLDPNITREEDYIYQVLGSKRIYVNKRNDIPELSPGDKSYKAVEYSPLYFGKNTHSRDPIKRQRRKREITDLNQLLNSRPSSNASFNHEYDTNEAENEQNELDRVRNLDEWKPAPPLKPPFKVLDPEDKTFKYKPKVTK